MEKLISNIAGKVHTEMLQGREHLVAPLTLIVPGVLNGSQGALLYPPEEISNNVLAWNGMPLLLRHPQDQNNQALSGRSPEVLNRQGLGMVLHARIQDQKLVAEGWFDVENTQRLAPEILDFLHSGKPIELSTGLFTKNEPAPQGATHNGTSYEFIARNYQPDHLAILVDEIGACSLNDGCGVLNKNPQDKKDQTMSLSETKKKELVDYIITNCEYCDEDERETLNKLSDEKLKARKSELEKSLADSAVVNSLQEFAGEEVKPTELADFVINAAKKNAEPPMDEEEEEDEEALAKAKKAKNKKTKNAEDEEGEEMQEANKKTTKNKTDEEWLAEAPESVQNTLKHARELEDRERQSLISQITSNVEDDKQRQAVVNRLKGKDLEELRDLVALAPKQEEDNSQVINYQGIQGGPAQNQMRESEDHLVVPNMFDD
jgi:hypothetical protein